MINNGRQWAKNLYGIRQDHVERYHTACDFAQANNLKSASDIGSGIGYGSWMLAEIGLYVDSYEIDSLSVEFGNTHWSHDRLTRWWCDLMDIYFAKRGDLLTCFEFIEHVSNPEQLLEPASHGFKWLICSVPNEEVIPFSQNKHHEHKRHYTPDEFRQLLADAGWEVNMIGGQKGKRGESARVQFETTDDCRTLVAICKGKV